MQNPIVFDELFSTERLFVVLKLSCDQDHRTAWCRSSLQPLIREMVCSSAGEIPTQPHHSNELQNSTLRFGTCHHHRNLNTWNHSSGSSRWWLWTRYALVRLSAILCGQQQRWAASCLPKGISPSTPRTCSLHHEQLCSSSKLCQCS